MIKKLQGQIARLRFKFLLPSLKINPRNNSRVAVYPRHRILYNRIKKSGNSSILLYMSDVLAGKSTYPADNYENAKAQSVRSTITPFDLPLQELLNFKSYYSFTIMRNPYARCLSTFLQKVAVGKETYKTIPGCGRGSPDGFEDFVSFLEHGGLCFNPHFYPQVYFFFLAPEDFSYIGKLENLDNDLRVILRANNIKAPDALSLHKPHPSERSDESKITGASEKVSQYYSDKLFRRVYDLYRQDFSVGKYDRKWDV